MRVKTFAFCVLLRYLLFTFINYIFHHDKKMMSSLWIESIRSSSSWLILVRYLFEIISLYLRIYVRVCMYVHAYITRYIPCVGENYRCKVNNFETATLLMNYDSIDGISIRNNKRVLLTLYYESRWSSTSIF